MSKEKKINVCLVINRYASSKIANWTESQINEYMERKRDIKFNSKCLRWATVHNNINFGLDNEAKRELKIEIHSTRIDIRNQGLYMYDAAEQCLKKIRTGKCVDPFVIEHIGKVLFPDKYAKTK